MITYSINRGIINKGDPRTRGWENVTTTVEEMQQFIQDGIAWCPGIIKKDFTGIKPAKMDITSSQCLGIDIDNTDGHFTVKNAIEDAFLSKFANFLYTTPSHSEEINRFRIVFVFDNFSLTHYQYEELAKYLSKKYKADSTTDICRLFYGNTEALFHDFGQVLTKSILTKIIKPDSNNLLMKRDITPAEAADLLGHIPPKTDYMTWMRVVSGIANTFDFETAVSLIDSWSPDEERGTEYKVAHPFPNVGIGSVVYLAKQYGYEHDKFTDERKIELGVNTVHSNSIHLADENYEEYMDLYKNGFPVTIDTGFAQFDEHFKVYKKNLTLVTGISSHGKTSFLAQCTVRYAERGGWKFGVFSPEDAIREIYMYRVAEMYIGKPFLPGYNGRMSEQEAKRAFEFISNHYYFIDPPSKEFTVEAIYNSFAELKAMYNIDSTIADPWNTFLHKKYDYEDKLEYIARQLNFIKYHAREYDLHNFLVAHPRKMPRIQGKDRFEVPTPMDVSDSIHFYNIPDNCITVYRIFGQNDGFKRTDGHTEVHVQKIKHKFMGRVGKVKFNYNSANQTYEEFVEQKYEMINFHDKDNVPF